MRIALDDFGTGYATMSQLLAFRFDKIKIDRSFVNNLGNDSDGEVIVRAIIGLAKGLGLVTTAEGIEKASQLADLRADGCLEGQGYLFGKAIPADGNSRAAAAANARRPRWPDASTSRRHRRLPRRRRNRRPRR